MSKTKRSRAALLNILALLLTALVVPAASAFFGEIDTSYGGNGSGYNFLQPSMTINSFPLEFSVVNASVLDSQDRQVVAGYVGYDDGDRTAFAIARFLSDGTLDTSFGPNTQGFNVISINDDEIINDIQIQSDGKIVAAGTYRDQNSGMLSWMILRFDSNGLLDSTFGSSGTGFETTTAFTTSYATSIALTSSDEIIVAGSAETGHGISYATLAKYDVNGISINSFGEYGIGYETITVAGTLNAFNDVALTPTGQIVAAGKTNNGGADQLLIAKFTANGVPVLGFGGSNTGFNTTTVASSSTSFQEVVVLSDGKIIAAGSRDSVQYALLARYNSNGVLDNTFGPLNDGFLAFQIYAEQRIDALLLESDQHVLVGGQTRNGTAETWFFIGRFDTDGNLDGSFGSNGIFKSNLSYSDGVASLNKNSAEKIVFAGTSKGLDQNNESFVVGQLLAASNSTSIPPQVSVPDPVQQSVITSIESITPTSETPAAIVIEGRFTEPIVNVTINEVPIAPQRWEQTPTEVVITRVDPGPQTIQIYNGAVPLLPVQKITIPPVAPKMSPAPVTPPTPTPETSTTTSALTAPVNALVPLNIYFAMASADLGEVSKKRITAWLKDSGGQLTKLQITGFAQPTPKGAKLDPALSLRRAQSVKEFLIQLGFKGEITTRGAGRTNVNSATSRYVEIVGK